MRIAVASRDGQTVAGHIGKCAEWIVFEAKAAPNSEHPRMEEVARITLPKDLVFHYYKDDGPHPLADCSAVIGASAGESFVAKMAKRGIKAVLTSEPDPTTAVTDYVRQHVTPPKPRPIGDLICKLRDSLKFGK
ncbi:MAG: NifB/NifX family molybdenum-iron cluster-binding protein [Gammaproteobacteria bacterium]